MDTNIRTFRNNSAAILWGFAVAFTTVLGLITYALLTKGKPDGGAGELLPLVIVVFWAADVGLLIGVFRIPLIGLRVKSCGVSELIEQYPLAKKISHFRASDLQKIKIEESKDLEGETYFKCIVTLGGKDVVLKESVSRAECSHVGDAVTEAFNLHNQDDPKKS